MLCSCLFICSFF